MKKRNMITLFVFVVIAILFFVTVVVASFYTESTIFVNKKSLEETQNTAKEDDSKYDESHTRISNTLLDRYVKYAKQYLKPKLNSETWDLLENIYNSVMSSDDESININQNILKNFFKFAFL